MEHLFDAGVLEHRCQRREVWQRQRVNQGVFFIGGELDQAHLLVVGIQAFRFSIHAQDGLPAKCSRKFLQCGVGDVGFRREQVEE